MSVPSRGRKQPARGSGLTSAWVWLVPLAIIGFAVFAARTFDRSDAEIALPTPRVEVTAPPATSTRVPAPAAAAAAPARATPRATGVATHAAAAPIPTAPRAKATAAPTHAATLAPTRAAPAVATSAPPATAATVSAAPTRAAVPTLAPTAQASGHAGSVALTFDAGADRGYAEDILDVLADQHVVGSFGITGQWARTNADLVRRMVADGHMVFNHTFDHRSFTGLSDSLGGLSASSRRAELDQADAIIAPLIGHSTRPFYRLPFGDNDAHVAADVGADGYTRQIGWTVDSEGWRGLQSTDILARCLKLAAPGAIYVMHVGRQSQDAIALPQVIASLRERGFTFARVDAE